MSRLGLSKASGSIPHRVWVRGSILLTLWSVTAWNRGTVPGITRHLVCGRLANPPPGVGAGWEGRSASQISVPLAINSWWFLLLRSEGGVFWGILRARVNGSAGELWAQEAKCPVRDAYSPQMKWMERRRKRDWGRDCLSFGLSVKSLVSSVILRKVLPAQLSLAVPCPPSVPLPLSSVLTHSSAHQTHFFPCKVAQPSCTSLTLPVLSPFQGLYIFLVYAIYNSEVRDAPGWGSVTRHSNCLLAVKGVAGVVVGATGSIGPTVLLEQQLLFRHDLLEDLLLC